MSCQNQTWKWPENMMAVFFWVFLVSNHLSETNDTHIVKLKILVLSWAERLGICV